LCAIQLAQSTLPSYRRDLLGVPSWCKSVDPHPPCGVLPPQEAEEEMTRTLSPKFGHYALPANRETIRRKADTMPDTKFGHLAISALRKLAFRGRHGPFDITIMPGVNARLYPRSNRCEKRAFAGVQIWDAVERQALSSAFDVSTSAPFIFMDVGANVGLYSLILAAHAEAQNKPIRILAFEPDPVNRARFEFNIKASNADIEVLPYAVSDEAGEGYMGGGDSNRGEVRLSENDDNPKVQIKTLYGVCKTEKLTHIDAMKVDIEGHDERALGAFFNAAPNTLWPHLLILETGRAHSTLQATSLLEMCTAHGYTITKRAGINSVLHLNKKP